MRYKKVLTLQINSPTGICSVEPKWTHSILGTKAMVSCYGYMLFKFCNLSGFFMKHSRHFPFSSQWKTLLFGPKSSAHSLIQIDSGETIYTVHFLNQQIEFWAQSWNTWTRWGLMEKTVAFQGNSIQVWSQLLQIVLGTLSGIRHTTKMGKD